MSGVFVGDGFVTLVIALSVLSGVGSFLQGRRDGRLKGGWPDFITEVTLALIVGLAVAYACRAYEIKKELVYAVVLVLSNNASDTMVWIRNLTINRINRNIGGGKGK